MGGNDSSSPNTSDSALLIGFHRQPLGVLLHADGYYDDDGNWIEDEPAEYDPWVDASPDVDSDGDGISDYDEVWGYEVYSISYATYYWVTTDPTNPDTDESGH